MNTPLFIRTLDFHELSVPLNWAAQEGWNPGLGDQLAFWPTDDRAFIGGFLGEQLVATISAVRYDDTFGFIGFYIVAPEYRGRGYGIQMWDAALKHLHGVSCIGLDGVMAQQDNYRKSGFVYAHRNRRYESRGQAASVLKPEQHSLGEGEEIVVLGAIPFDELIQYDSRQFPTRRADFLKPWTNQDNHRGFAIRHKGEICAYGVIRPCLIGHKIGPLFAQTSQQAFALYAALTNGLKNQEPVYIDPPTENIRAIAMAESLGMTLVFETARMYKGNAPGLLLDNIYGITTFELG